MTATSTITSLGDTLQALLTTAVTALDATTKGAPTLQYVSPGKPILDLGCDQVAVYAQRISEETTQPVSPIPAQGRRYARGRVNLPTFVILVVRCLTISLPGEANWRPPTPAEVTIDGLAHAEDGWALWNGYTAALRTGTLLDGLCDDVHFDGMLPLDPEGGLAGWTLTLRAQLGGIPT